MDTQVRKNINLVMDAVLSVYERTGTLFNVEVSKYSSPCVQVAYFEFTEDNHIKTRMRLTWGDEFPMFYLHDDELIRSLVKRIIAFGNDKEGEMNGEVLPEVTSA